MWKIFTRLKGKQGAHSHDRFEEEKYFRLASVAYESGWNLPDSESDARVHPKLF